LAVSITLDSFPEEDIVEYLQDLGYVIEHQEDLEENDYDAEDPYQLTREEVQLLMDMLSDPQPGTMLYNIYHKLAYYDYC